MNNTATRLTQYGDDVDCESYILPLAATVTVISDMDAMNTVMHKAIAD